jgi:hypothetical protein
MMAVGRIGHEKHKETQKTQIEDFFFVPFCVFRGN